MSLELLLRFSDKNQLTVTFDGKSLSPIAFENPITAAELEELRWYLEVYAVQYTADVDDDHAWRIISSFKRIGITLYKSVFSESNSAAGKLIDEFLSLDEPQRLVTIQSGKPEILALPWELLHQPDGAFFFNDSPRISIRRNLAKGQAERFISTNQPKEKLRLLMLVSRPKDASFIDPRADSQAVMAAIERYGAGRIELEFLRPGTLAALVERLENKALPQVDILHFDGHGVFDTTGAIAKQDMAHFKGFGENTGYLLLEDSDGSQDLISAERLGQLLNKQGLGLVVLSACQSSMMGQQEQSQEEGEESGAIGSVAARFTQTGVQSVIAMSYSVLVKTTESLFGAFYGNLVQGKGIGESLDNARRQLLMNPDRGERQRGKEQIKWKLTDWFVPTLYQLGSDRGMVLPSSSVALSETDEEQSYGSKLPSTRAGFFGRRRELWAIERAFTPKPDAPQQETRRMTICGFGGQGKTALAAEAGRWLVRSGLFEAAVFVDYAAFQGVDAVGVAVSTLARDLETNLIDADAATVALGQRRVLLILDNLEDLSAETQQGLLTQAVAWSAAGQSRVLITTRQADLGHGDYGRSGYAHQQISLEGLRQEDAIDYFQALMAVPPVPARLPQRKNLIGLFAKVDFHPLSIALVAEQLRVRSIVDVELALDRLLGEVPAGQKKDQSLIASLNLSLERLDKEAQQLVRQLGVFQGGVFETELLAITKLIPEQWQQLRQQLEASGLVIAENLEGVGVSVPFLKFHPTLARMLWASLTESDRLNLQQRHRERYYSLSQYLYFENEKSPHAVWAIAERELPNLMMAVKSALNVEEDWAVEFVTYINLFLNINWMQADLASLAQQMVAATKSAAAGSQAWYSARSNAGEQLWLAGQPQQAIVVFQETLAGLGETMSYQRCSTLVGMGRCWADLGDSKQAALTYRQALHKLEQLEQSESAKHLIGATQADLARVLREMGDYRAAQQACEISLAIDKELGDKRGEAVSQIQLGTLAMVQGNLAEAETCYKSSLIILRTLNETAKEADAWHSLGMVYASASSWELAEQAYRSALQLSEAQGDVVGVAKTLNQLAIVFQFSGRLKEAEAWYWKTLKAEREIGNDKDVARVLSNLAVLLQTQSNFSEAQRLAEEALAIDKTLDPAAAEIWKTYNLLAQIAKQQGAAAKAQDYRRLARQSYAAFAGAQQMLKQQEGSIQAIAAATQDGELRQQLEEALPEAPAEIATAIRQLLAGERDEELLCEPLNYRDSLIVSEVLRQL